MTEELLWRFLEYRKRKQAVIIVTILTGLVAVWPAADEYMAARERVRSAKSGLKDSRHQVDKLPQFTQVFEKRTTELRKLEGQAVDEQAAQRLRGTMISIIRETGCKMKEIKLANSMLRDWTENDSPINNTALIDRGGDTPFQLATRQMTLSISGSMNNIKDFLTKLNEIDALLHTKSFSLKSSEKTGKTLNIDLWLFDLPRKATT